MQEKQTKQQKKTKQINKSIQKGKAPLNWLVISTKAETHFLNSFLSTEDEIRVSGQKGQPKICKDLCVKLAQIHS